MSKAVGPAGFALTLLLAAACASQQKTVAAHQGTALQTALVHGRAELGCPSATALLLSSGLAEPAAEGREAEHFAYTFGIEGCGAHTTVVVACERESGACTAGSPGGSSPD